MSNDKITAFIEQTEAELRNTFDRLKILCERNSYKVYDAFISEEVSARHFNPTTGYGYGDDGKEKLSRLYARVFGAKDALVSPHIVSGTHALSLCLFGLLRPLDTMLCITGRPYDTLCDTIGMDGEEEDIGSLSNFAIGYKQIDLLESGDIDIFRAINTLKLEDKIKLVYIQRSRGYEWRESLSINQIRDAANAIKKTNPGVIVMVDNCYGEFCGPLEPTEVGADIMAGSLIKNPGGGIAPSGGYIAGTAELVALVAARLTAPGLGFEVGSSAAGYLPYYQGLFLAPHTVLQALMGAELFSAAFTRLGFECLPEPGQSRNCITQAICFNNEELLLKFMKAVQASSPIDSTSTPIPWGMPGYSDDVVMAAGTFISGSSIELSADAPVKPPYIAYFQGGLTYEHCKYTLKNVLAEIGLV